MDRVQDRLASGATSLDKPFGPPRPIADECPTLLRAYEAAGRDEGGDDKIELLVARIGPALVACDCRADLPALRSQLWFMLHNPDPMRELTVELAPDAPALALPATTPWRDASARLTPATGRAWFAITP